MAQPKGGKGEGDGRDWPATSSSLPSDGRGGERKGGMMGEANCTDRNVTCRGET